MLVHSAVKFLHLFITVDLLFLKFFLSSFQFHYILHLWGQTVSLDNIKLFLADFTDAAQFVCFDKEVRQVIASLRSILRTLC